MSDDPHFDHLPRGATGDWEIETENGTRIVLSGLGGDDPRWWRIPGTPESSRDYSDRPYPLAALRALPDGETTWGNEPVTVGLRMIIGQGHMSDLWHTSRVVSIRRVGPVEIGRRRDRLTAVKRISGAYTGLYEPGYLDDLRAEWEPLPLPDVLATAADKVAERSTWHTLDEVAERLGLDADAIRERAARRQAGESDE